MRFKHKFFIILLLVNFFFLQQQKLIQAQEKSPAISQALIINQVRGQECCSPGEAGHLGLQLETVTKQGIPAFFSFRYDALLNDEMVNLIKQYQQQYPNLVKPSLLVEVTPELAVAAGVEYHGRVETWYKAETVSTLGYSQQDSQKIIDTLVAVFEEKFDQLPQLTTAWMIDTASLNYLHEKYQVQVHQITREQWKVDSYNLLGGPAHYPFPAAENWLFVPDFQRENGPLIVRQTVSDPLYNYGDHGSSFTSQPNDYALDGKNIDYFKKLIDQAIEQPAHQGFILLGLENSMGPEYQAAYANQLRYLAELKEKNKLVFPDLEELQATWWDFPVRLYQGEDLVNDHDQTSAWVTAANYRLRLRTNNNQVFIDDIRLYSSALTDPYSEQKAINQGYWITPFLIDGSVYFQDNNQQDKNIWQKLFGPPDIDQWQLKHDQDVKRENINKIVLPDKSGDLQWTKQDENLILQYQSQAEEEIMLTFYPEKIISNYLPEKVEQFLSDISPVEVEQKNQQLKLLTRNQNEEQTHALEISCEDQECEWQFKIDEPEFAKLRQQLYPFYFPEQKPCEIDWNKTVFYVDNRYALAGRNPVRLVLAPHDEQGYKTVIDKEIKVKTQPEATYVNTRTQEGFSEIHFIDISQRDPMKMKIEVELEGKTLSENIYFAPNCKQDLSKCLKSPRQLWWYLRTLVQDKIKLSLQTD